MNGYSILLHNIAPGKYIVIKVEYGLQLHFKIFLNKSDRKKTTTKIITKMLMILDFKILSLWFVIEDWWYNTLTRKNNWFLNVLVKSNFATPTPFGSVSCFVVGICLSNYNFNSFLIHQASYSKEYQRYLMHRENLGSIWKIGRYPIKVSEVLYRPVQKLQLFIIWPVLAFFTQLFGNSLRQVKYSVTQFYIWKSLFQTSMLSH